MSEHEQIRGNSAHVADSTVREFHRPLLHERHRVVGMSHRAADLENAAFMLVIAKHEVGGRLRRRPRMVGPFHRLAEAEAFGDSLAAVWISINDSSPLIGVRAFSRDA